MDLQLRSLRQSYAIIFRRVEVALQTQMGDGIRLGRLKEDVMGLAEAAETVHLKS